MLMRRLFYPVTFFTLFYLSSALSANENIQGMRDWSKLNDVHIQKSQNKLKNLLAIPHWIPGYLFRNMDLPAPPLHQRELINKFSYEANTLKNVAIGATVTLIARPIMNYTFGGGGFPDNRFWKPDLKATFWHLLSASTLTQILSAESGASGLYRAFVLTNFSPWLRSWLQSKELSSFASTLLSQLPAHVFPWDQIVTNLFLLSSPLKVSQQRISFEDDELNGLTDVYLQSPLFSGNFDPVIDIKPLSADAPWNTQHQPDKAAWQNLLAQCRAQDITYLRLYPVMEAGISHLYLRVWKADKPGEKILVGRYSASSPMLWWTDLVMFNHPLSDMPLNPLARPVLSQLPAYFDASLNPGSIAPDPLSLMPSHTRSHEDFAALMDDQHGLILFDWNTHYESSRLPLITLLTEDIASPVTEHELTAIGYSQPKQLRPYKRAISRAAHDLLWLAAALYLERFTGFLGDKIYSPQE